MSFSPAAPLVLDTCLGCLSLFGQWLLVPACHEGGTVPSVSSRAPAESEKGLTVIRVGGRAGPPEKGGTPARHEGVESHCLGGLRVEPVVRMVA